MGRIKNAAEKLEPFKNPAQSQYVAHHGTAADSPWLPILNMADAIRQFQVTSVAAGVNAPPCVQEQLKELQELVGQRATDAILARNVATLGELVSLLERGAGSTATDKRRWAILAAHENFQKTWKRDPSPKELQESHGALKGVAPRVFRRLLKETGLKTTNAKLTESVRARWEQVCKGRETFAAIAELKRRLSTTELGKEFSSYPDERVFGFLESLGVEFEPEESLRVHHRILTKQEKGPPTAGYLLTELPPYCRKALKSVGARDLDAVELEGICRNLGLDMCPMDVEYCDAGAGI